MAEREPIGVIGAGWVGLVTAACFAELGHDVHCRDILPEKIDALRRGEVPIHEPGLAELIARNSERLHFTVDMDPVRDGAQLLFCCVDTPPTYSGDADLSRVERVLEELGQTRDHALVMKSTVPVGTGRSIARRHPDLGYVSNPEFLKEGSAVSDFMHPDRVVVGAGPDSAKFADRVAALYEPLGAAVVRTDVASAEMIKLASNAFLATKISFINEIANVSEELGADVTEVARGMGLDTRIGPKFLQAGIGYGGSCLVGEETVLVRRSGVTRLCTFEALFDSLCVEYGLDPAETFLIEPDDLEVLSWKQGDGAPAFRPVSCATRRDHVGEVLEIRTKMGRRVRCTPDHPFVVSSPRGDPTSVKPASELTSEDWIPLAQGAPEAKPRRVRRLNPLRGALGAGLSPEEVIVRPAREEIAAVAGRSARDRATALDHARGSRIRLHDVVRCGALRLDEAERLRLDLSGASVGTAGNGTHVPISISADECFWRVVGLYLAEGHRTIDGARHRISWSFHPTREQHLVDEVAEFWRRQGVKVTVRRMQTTMSVQISSRVLSAWWVDVLGLGRNCYEHRLPDLIWDANEAHKRALLAGMWHGDGSWSYVAGGPSVVLEYGTASRALVDGLLRLLGDLGVAARLKVGRTAKSRRDNYWVVIAGADQIERVLDCVPESQRSLVRESIGSQVKRILPTGYRHHGAGFPAWLRHTATERIPFSGSVYSLEVPDAHTFVTSYGLTVHNCFPKDVSALKQLAGNSGYHFQLLTAVIEVNELQKRRTISKLQKHLGSLVGKEIALLGLAFKPETDDVREATSLVLAARLQGEGAHVRVYDPVATDRARELVGGARVCDSALEALDGADGAVLVTEWPEFRELDWTEARERMARPLVVDGRNYLDEDVLTAAGFTYEGVGRAAERVERPASLSPAPE